MDVSKDVSRSAEDVLSTPLPGETLAMFYARSRMLTQTYQILLIMAHFKNTGEYWAQKAYGTSDNRGKELRRDGFARAEERYGKITLWVVI